MTNNLITPQSEISPFHNTDIDEQVMIDDPIITYQDDGQVSSQSTVSLVDSNVVSETQNITWSYYPNGDVDIITISVINGSGVEISHQEIKHYTDGLTQPIMTQTGGGA